MYAGILIRYFHECELKIKLGGPIVHIENQALILKQASLQDTNDIAVHYCRCTGIEDAQAYMYVSWKSILNNLCEYYYFASMCSCRYGWCAFTDIVQVSNLAQH